jgi:hypothetical protein
LAALVRVPQGDWEVLGPSAPALRMTDLMHCSTRRVPLARIHSHSSLHGIEREDYSEDQDYSHEPPSNVASHSRGTTLYGTLA